MQHPTGMITFLLTDIEGSTFLWENHPEEMLQALELHDELAKQRIRHHGGKLIKSRGEGDSLFAVFEEPLAAVLAAADLQRAFLETSWPDGITMKVRMALHCGQATVRQDDYFGPAVNRCARLRTLAHGSQILLSNAISQQLDELLPAKYTLKPLGEHFLRDMASPEPIYQLMAPGLPIEFPPLPSAKNLPSRDNLPTLLTSFIGREAELSELEHYLERTRLLTLTGTGGCGKTRLAIEFAERVQPNFPNGVWFVELTSLTDPTLIPHTIAQTMGISTASHPLSAQQIVLDYLQSRYLLLLLDNCEHIIEGVARWVVWLLQYCAQLKVVATSREALNITGETIYRVPSLSLPSLQDRPLSTKTVLESEAVRLFLDRAQTVAPTLSITPNSLEHIAAICQRLDGIPLAIELAAARCRSLSLSDIETRLNDMFSLLGTASRVGISRHHTLRAALDWSYTPLSPQQKRLLHRLAFFSGGWKLEAAEAIGYDPPSTQEEPTLQQHEVLDTLAALTDRSLVQYDIHADRFYLLEPTRQYAIAKLRERKEEAIVRERHANYFLELAEQRGDDLVPADRFEKDAESWIACLDADIDNLRSILLNNSLPVELRARTAIAMWRYWLARERLQEGRQHLQNILHDLRLPPLLKAKALHVAAALACKEGDYEVAEKAIRESEKLFMQANDIPHAAYTKVVQGEIAHARGDYKQAYNLFTDAYNALKIAEATPTYAMAETLHGVGDAALACNECNMARAFYLDDLSMRHTLKDSRGIASALHSLGNVALFMGKYTDATRHYQESIEIREALQDNRGLSASLNNLGGVALARGDYLLAEQYCQRSLNIRHQIGDKRGIAFSLLSLGYIEREKRSYGAALQFAEESLRLFQELGNRVNAATALCECTLILIRQEQFDRARTFLKQALQACQETSSHHLCLLVLETSAELATTLQNLPLAAQLLGAQNRFAALHAVPLPPIRKAAYDRLLAFLRAHLTSAKLEQNLQKGGQADCHVLIEQAAKALFP